MIEGNIKLIKKKVLNSSIREAIGKATREIYWQKKKKLRPQKEEENEEKKKKVGHKNRENFYERKNS